MTITRLVEQLRAREAFYARRDEATASLLREAADALQALELEREHDAEGIQAGVELMHRLRSRLHSDGRAYDAFIENRAW